MITVFLVDGVFDLLGITTVFDPHDDFIRECTVDHMMKRIPLVTSQQMDMVDEIEKGYIEQVIHMNHIGNLVGASDPKPVNIRVIDKAQLEKSAPGFIYLYATVQELRECHWGTRIILLLRDRTTNMYLDVSLNPKAFGYGLELPEADVGLMAWLAVEPGVTVPIKIEPVEYVNRTYMHHLAYF